MDYPALSSIIVSHEDFILFHKMDRDLYTILVNTLSREPAESMQTLAMWLWLERVGFHNVVKKIMSLPFILINEVADETLICLSCINNISHTNMPNYSSEGSNNDIPLLQSLLDKEITLQFFYENRVEALQGVTKMEQDVCVRALTDIMEQAIIRNAAETQKNSTFWFGSIGPSNLRIGGDVAELVVQNNINNNNEVVPADDRTLFVTFSKGYRVEEWEVREFFSMAYGDCIEALYMQEVQPSEQALFARIVFHKVSTIDMILRGASKAKFAINGKHVWARKFVPKRTTTKTSLLPSLSNLPGEASGN